MARKTVTTSATKLTGVERGIKGGSSLAIEAPDAADLFIETTSAACTVADGWRVPAGSTITLDLGFGEDVYGVIASGSQSIRVLQTGMS